MEDIHRTEIMNIIETLALNDHRVEVSVVAKIWTRLKSWRNGFLNCARLTTKIV